MRACLAEMSRRTRERTFPGPSTLATRRRADELPFDVDETEEDALTRERAWSVLSEEDEVAARDAFEQQRVAKIKKQRNDDRRARDVHAACRRLCAAFNGNSASRQWLESAAPEQARRLDDVSTRWDALLEEFWPGGPTASLLSGDTTTGPTPFSTDAPAVGAAARRGAWRALDDACARVLPQLFPSENFLREGRRSTRRVEACLNNADVLGNGRRLVLRVFGVRRTCLGRKGPI